MKKKICKILCASLIAVSLFGSMVCYADNDFDSVNPEELSKEELVDAYNELRDAYNALQGADELDTSFDPGVQTDIIFEDVFPFFSSDQNYHTITSNIGDFKIEELKTAIGNYATTHQDDAVILNEILYALNEYGDFDNLVLEVDSFDGEKTIFYDGYTGIDSEHYVYPYSSGSDYKLRLGFVKDGWLFAEDMMLKRYSDSVNDGIWFSGDSFEFERETLGNGLIMEYKEERLYDSDVDYLASDMSEEMIVRFEAENGEKIDYTLTDTDKSALQNVAKFVKLKNMISDIKYNSNLYYPEIPEERIVFGGLYDNKNPFLFDVKLVDKNCFEENYEDYVVFKFELENNYEKTISEINGTATLINSYGKQIMRMHFNFTDLTLESGEMLKDKEMFYQCKSYEDSDIELYNIAYDDMNFVYVPKSVVFTDGTVEVF